MKRCFAVAVACWCLGGCDSRPDHEKLQGRWRLLGMSGWFEFDLPGVKGGPTVLTFTKDGFSYTNDAGDPGPEQTVSGTFSCDPSKRPREITFTFKGRTVVGIYSFAGSTLRICVGAKDRVPPATFEGSPGGRPALLIFTRAE
jgi:uncharacterized protein (TIGR03067 family)